MRFQLVLDVGKRSVLPIDYQYSVASWVYSVLDKGNSEFSKWLHDHGYGEGVRKFKLFCFSRFFFPKFEVMGDRLKILSDFVSLQISFAMDKSVEPFVYGLFEKNHFQIADSQSTTDFSIRSIECLPSIVFQSTERFKLLSPLCLSVLNESRNTATYLSPDDPNYGTYLKSNLLNKYQSVHTDFDSTNIPFSFRILSPFKSSLNSIKKGNAQETRIRGYLFDFEISTLPELIQFSYQTGFGEKNSMGFGFVERKKSWKKK